ncbi:uncharacterized protein LOC136032293 [Artemia franciscana]|uniref:uncharacterized protein LOC136032293 n=1 Tax=Artemia franciscana TaxID=6661 RepID=UPI0032D9BCC9
MTIEDRSNQFHVENLSYFNISATPPRSNGEKDSMIRRWLRPNKSESLDEAQPTDQVPQSTTVNMRHAKPRHSESMSTASSELSLTDSKRKKLKNWFRTRTRSRDECSAPSLTQSQRFMSFRRPMTPQVSDHSERPSSTASTITDVDVHLHPKIVPPRERNDPNRRSNSIATVPKSMPPLKQQLSDPGVRWGTNSVNPRYLEDENSASTNTSSTVCGSELTHSSDTLTSSRSRTRTRNHGYDCCCSRCLSKAQNKVTEDVVIIYAGLCPYSSAWAKYIHKELFKEMEMESAFKIHFRQLEEIIQDSMSSQDVCEVKTEKRASIQTARLQIVILSSSFLDITYSHAMDEWARLLSPKRVACLLLGVKETKDMTSLHRAALISYESWYRIQVGHEDSTSFKKFINTATKIYKSNNSQRRRLASVPDTITVIQKPGFEVIPDILGVAIHEAVIILEKPLETEDQCSVSFAWSDCTYKIGTGDIRRITSSVLKTTVPNVYSSSDTSVELSVRVNNVCIGVRKLKYVAPLTDLKNLLRNTPEPLELISAAIQSECSSRDDLVQIISKLTENHSRTGIHLLPHPNGIFAVSSTTGLISPIDESDEEKIGYQIPRPLDMTYLIPPPPKPLPFPKPSIKSEKIALVNHNESFDSAYYNLQSPNDSLNEVSASSSCITAIYIPPSNVELSYLNLPPIPSSTIQYRQQQALEVCRPLAMDTAEESFIATENKSLHTSLVEGGRSQPPTLPPKNLCVINHLYMNIPGVEEKNIIYENITIRTSRSSKASRGSGGNSSLCLDSDNDKLSFSSDGVMGVDELLSAVRNHHTSVSRALSSSSSQRSSSTPSTSLALSDHEQLATSSGSCSPSPSVTPDSGMSEIPSTKDSVYYSTPRQNHYRSSSLKIPPKVPSRPAQTLSQPRPRLSTFGK